MIRRTLVYLALSLLSFGFAPAAMQSSVSQYGITWTFDQQYEVGQFANGDYWVAGPITLTDITPAFDGTHNGWEVNPCSTFNQGFDTRVSGFIAGMVPALPLTVPAPASVVKSISVDHTDTGCRPCLRTAAVLTVVASIPPDSGATVFRPPYHGKDKPYYTTSDIRTDKLPSLTGTGSEGTLAGVRDNFQRVQLDHKDFWSGRHMHPEENLPDYGSDIAIRNNTAALRLMLDDPLQDKMPALVNYLQAGIDWYHMFKNGLTWYTGGGHGEGRKLPVAFTGVMLDNQEIKDAVFNADDYHFGENTNVYYSDVIGQPLFGKHCTDYQYWQRIVQEVGAKDCRDPYGYTDGLGYQFCCTAMPGKAAAVALHIMPEVRYVWNRDFFLDYIERWVTVGKWMQPDPCAPDDGVWENRGRTYGPDSTNPGDCIRDIDSTDGIGRYPDMHGENVNAGHYGSAFANEMYDAYWDSSFTGIDGIGKVDNIKEVEYRLLANPVRDFLEVEVNRLREAITVDIFNARGTVVKQHTGRQVILVLPVHELPNGIYFYRLTVGGMVTQDKLVISR